MNPKRTLRYYALRLFRIKASARNVSLGLAIGFTPNWFPTFGFGPALSVVLAKVFRGNLISAFLGGISGTFLWPFLFYLNYKVGGYIIHSFYSFFGSIKVTSSLGHLRFKSAAFGLKFLIGACINTLLFGLVVYFVTFFLMRKYRDVYLRMVKNTK